MSFWLYILLFCTSFSLKTVVHPKASFTSSIEATVAKAPPVERGSKKKNLRKKKRQKRKLIISKRLVIAITLLVAAALIILGLIFFFVQFTPYAGVSLLPMNSKGFIFLISLFINLIIIWSLYLTGVVPLAAIALALSGSFMLHRFGIEEKALINATGKTEAKLRTEGLARAKKEYPNLSHKEQKKLVYLQILLLKCAGMCTYYELKSQRKSAKSWTRRIEQTQLTRKKAEVHIDFLKQKGKVISKE